MIENAIHPDTLYSNDYHSIFLFEQANHSIVVEEHCFGPLCFDVFDSPEHHSRVIIPVRSCEKLSRTFGCRVFELKQKLALAMESLDCDLCDLMDLLDCVGVRYLSELDHSNCIRLVAPLLD